MQVEITPVNPQYEFERLAELYNMAYNHPVSAADFAEDYYRAGSTYHLTAAKRPEGTILGFSEAIRFPGSDPGQFHLTIVVDPASRKRGVGHQLYEDALSFCGSQGARRISARVREDCAEGLHFLTRRGFSEKHFSCEMALDLAAFDDAPFGDIEQRMAEIGIRLTCMAELGDTPEARRALFTINNTTGREIPGESSDPWESYEEFVETVCQQSWYDPAGQLVAQVEKTGEFAGMCAIALYKNRRTAYNLHTGVYYSFRGQGIALAMKVAGIRYARACGALSLWTNNKPINAPMLAVNRKLGFRQKPGITIFDKEL